MLLSFLTSDEPRYFKFAYIQTNPANGQPAGDPIDAQLMYKLGLSVEVESERPECLEVEMQPGASLDTGAPLGKFVALSAGGPFRISARLVDAVGNVKAIGGYLAIVSNDVAEIPAGDLALMLAPAPAEKDAPTLIVASG